MRNKWILFLLVSCKIIFCQYPFYKQFSVNDGLPSNTIYDISQDSKGFIWIATDNGICKYDGYEFKIFNSDSINILNSTGIKEDKLGRIWFANFDNTYYYIEKNRLHQLTIESKNSSFNQFFLNDSFLFIPFFNGVHIYNIESLTITKTIQTHQIIHSFFSTTEFYYIDKEKIVYKITNTLIPEKIDSGYNLGYIDDKNENLFLFNSKTPNHFAIKSKQNKNIFSFPDNEFIQNIVFPNKEQIFCTKKGALFMNSKKEFKSYLTHFSISNIIIDKNNNYWVSTLNGGLLFIQNLSSEVFDLNEIKPNKLTILSPTEVEFSTKNNSIFIYNLRRRSVTSKLFTNDIDHEIIDYYKDSFSKTTYVSSNLFYKESTVNKSNFGISVKDFEPIDNRYIAISASGIIGQRQELQAEPLPQANHVHYLQ